jgi:hypothetical protein
MAAAASPMQLEALWSAGLQDMIALRGKASALGVGTGVGLDCGARGLSDCFVGLSAFCGLLLTPRGSHTADYHHGDKHCEI